MTTQNFGEPSAGGFIDTHFDFTTCQRPDGSFYGTGGTCRKGTETSAASKGDKKDSSKSGGGASAAQKNQDIQNKMSSNTKKVDQLNARIKVTKNPEVKAKLQADKKKLEADNSKLLKERQALQKSNPTRTEGFGKGIQSSARD